MNYIPHGWHLGDRHGNFEIGFGYCDHRPGNQWAACWINLGFWTAYAFIDLPPKSEKFFVLACHKSFKEWL